MSVVKVGFITPQNEIYLMDYNEVSDFCKLLCEKEENIDKFNKFSKNYKYFYPYFDFVMFELEYVFINPLLDKNTYLKKVGNGLYKVSDNNISIDNKYEQITDLAKRIKNGGNYPYLVSCSDTELNIRKCDINDIHKCMIDPNGFTMISSSDLEKDGNHEITSSTVVNQLLITSDTLFKEYDVNSYTASYLIENFGFIRSDSLEYGNMIGINKFLNDEAKEYVRLCVSEKGCFFHDWSKMTNVNDNVKNYDIKGR